MNHAAWIAGLRERYATYSPPPEAIGMTTRNELCFVESYARDAFGGAGRIVDLGCWYGATTAALARGVRANEHVDQGATVEGYDLFRWEPWMARHEHRLETRGTHYEQGDSFLPDVKELLRSYADIVQLEARDLSQPQPPGEPIEFLFVDAMKSWSLGQAIVSSFFPSLIPGESVVVQQDFVWYHPSILSVHLLMWHLRDHFEFLHHVPSSCSSAFRYTKAVDLTQQPPPPPDFFTLEMIHDAYEYSYGCVEPKRVSYIEAAKLFFLLDRGFYGPAVEQAEDLLGGDRKLNPDLEEGIARVLKTYRTRAERDSAVGETQAIRSIEAIEQLMPAGVDAN